MSGFWPSYPNHLVIRCALIFSITVMGLNSAVAEEPSVRAMLSSGETGVGQPVELQIKVMGARNASPSTDISVDGLDIRSAGQMQSFEMRNFDITSSVTYNYTITPLRTGTFTIPAQIINVAGKTLRTDELRLEVTAGSNRSTTGGNRATLDPKDLVSAELIIPKKNVYVGELVPVEIRVMIDSRARVVDGGNSLLAGPQITGQGFTVQKAQRPAEGEQTMNGRRFHTLVYKSAIAAAKAGKLEIGPAQLETLLQWPRARSKRFAPQDIFGMDDAFDSLMPNPFTDMTQPVPVKIASEPVTIEVKTLPPNAPASFAGAIGNFTMASEVNPKSGQVGDPFSVTARISGRGNFDRVTAPVVSDERGWRQYPPTSNFKQDDDVGFSGIKTFETVLSPNEPKDKVPEQVFTYFDSLKEEYITLRSDPIPIRVEGGLVTTTTSAQPGKAPKEATAQSPTGKQQDILYQLTELPAASQSFVPLYGRPWFWLAQLVPLLVFVALAGWKIRLARLNNREMQRREALQRESTELHRSLRRDDLTDQEYFSQASRAVQVKIALARDLDPNAIDAETAANAFNADEEMRTRLRRLFERSDEARYSGSDANGVSQSGSEPRLEILELMEKLKF